MHNLTELLYLKDKLAKPIGVGCTYGLLATTHANEVHRP